MIKILYNPLACNGQGEKKASEVKEALKGEEIEFLSLLEIKDMKKFMDELPEEESVVLCGGDGTLYKFVNAIDGFKPKNKVYYFPSGTGNDFAHDIADKKLDNGLYLINDYIINLPHVTVNGNTSCFLNGVGYGIDGYCCEVGDKLREKSDKPVNYAGIAIKGLLFFFKPKNVHIVADGKEYNFKKAWLAPTMNGRFYGGGMNMAPSQNRLNTAKRVSCVVLSGSGKLKTLMVFPSIFEGKHVEHKDIVTVIEGHNITVEFDKPCALQIDGETVLDVLKYEVKS